jgi:hypothetical protein
VGQSWIVKVRTGKEPDQLHFGRLSRPHVVFWWECDDFRGSSGWPLGGAGRALYTDLPA